MSLMIFAIFIKVQSSRSKCLLCPPKICAATKTCSQSTNIANGHFLEAHGAVKAQGPRAAEDLLPDRALRRSMLCTRLSEICASKKRPPNIHGANLRGFYLGTALDEAGLRHLRR